MEDRLGHLLSISEAAERLGVNKKTLRAWADKGHIEHVRTPTGYRLFDPEVLEAFAASLRVGPERKIRLSKPSDESK